MEKPYSMKNLKINNDYNMNWFNYYNLNDNDLIKLNQCYNQINKIRKKYNIKINKIKRVHFEDDYESSWTKYVGIDRNTREELRKIQIIKPIKSLPSKKKKEKHEIDLKQNDNLIDNNLTDEIIQKKIETLKPKIKNENLIDNNFDIPLEIKNERNMNKYTNDNLNDINNDDNEINNNYNDNFDNNNNNQNSDSTESDMNSKKDKKIKIPSNNNLTIKFPELENSKITNIENLEVNNNLNKGNLSKEHSLKNIIKEEEIKIQNNDNLNKKGIKDLYSSSNNFTFPLNSYRAIQISTESPIQQNYHINNYNSEKEQIFQVKSMPKKRQENNIKQLINQKREREILNLNMIKKLNTPSNKIEFNNFNNSSPISIIKNCTQTPSLFSNQSESNNIIFNNDFSNFQLDNFSSLNNDISITNNDFPEINNIQNPLSSKQSQKNTKINNQNTFINKNNFLNNDINRYIKDYEELNDQRNIDIRNNNLNNKINNSCNNKDYEELNTQNNCNNKNNNLNNNNINSFIKDYEELNTQNNFNNKNNNLTNNNINSYIKDYEELNTQRNIDLRKNNLNNKIINSHNNTDYEELNNQNNIDIRNNSLKMQENSPVKNRLIISKMNGKIVIKSIPIILDDES